MIALWIVGVGIILLAGLIFYLEYTDRLDEEDR